jgi:very-short-patch-repair endonuclease
MFTLKGIKRFLCDTRKYIPPEILDYYNIVEHNKINIDERMWLANIKKAFPNDEIIEQYRVDKYLVDAYLPAHNIIIEVDEHGHSAYNKEDESERTACINQQLDNPRWIRFNPYRANIFEVLGLINTSIKK